MTGSRPARRSSAAPAATAACRSIRLPIGLSIVAALLLPASPPARAFDRSVFARARHGVPVGVASLGWVRGRASGPSGPGQDRDRDGIPDKFDVDDNGNLVLDVLEKGRPPVSPEVRRMTASLPLAACPTAVCSGSK